MGGANTVVTKAHNVYIVFNRNHILYAKKVHLQAPP